MVKRFWPCHSSGQKPFTEKQSFRLLLETAWQEEQGWRCNVGGKIDRHTLEGHQPEFSPALDIEKK